MLFPAAIFLFLADFDGPFQELWYVSLILLLLLLFLLKIYKVHKFKQARAKGADYTTCYRRSTCLLQS